MIAADTSSLIAYFGGDSGVDVEAVDAALALKRLRLPPAVLSELLSDPLLPPAVRRDISQLPILEIQKDYWLRVGNNRSKLIAKKRKARLADCLIAQSCIDDGVSLITRDSDFRHFEKFCGLKLF